MGNSKLRITSSRIIPQAFAGARTPATEFMKSTLALSQFYMTAILYEVRSRQPVCRSEQGVVFLLIADTSEFHDFCRPCPFVVCDVSGHIKEEVAPLSGLPPFRHFVLSHSSLLPSSFLPSTRVSILCGDCSQQPSAQDGVAATLSCAQPGAVPLHDWKARRHRGRLLHSLLPAAVGACP